MLKRLRKPQHHKLAEKAAREVSPEGGVGEFLGTTEEDAHLTSYRFESKLKGYSGWEWTVVVYQSKKSALPTVSEVVLLPSEKAVVAPPWVPWSERKAEIEKLQAEELAVSDLEVSKDAESDTKEAAKRPPLRKRRIKRLIQNQNDNQGDGPGESSE